MRTQANFSYAVSSQAIPLGVPEPQGSVAGAVNPLSPDRRVTLLTLLGGRDDLRGSKLVINRDEWIFLPTSYCYRLHENQPVTSIRC